MADKLMYILNNDTQNYPFSRSQLMERLNTQLNEVPKVVKITNKKTLL